MKKTVSNLSKDQELRKYSKLSDRELMMEFRTSEKGLSFEDAEQRLEEFGENKVDIQKPDAWYVVLVKSFMDPFIYVLAGLLFVSALTKDYEAVVVMSIMIVVSAVIRFIQDFKAQQESLALQDLVKHTCAVKREGETKERPMEEVVPGDIVYLSAGDMIPADSVLIWTKDLFVNQSSLTGESMPVEKYEASKQENLSSDDSSAIDLSNLIFMGTDVLSGQGEAIILKTGQQTFFGDIAKQASGKRELTNFDRDLNHISKLLLRMVMVLFPIVFLINGVMKGDWTQAFFFAIAVAVGLTPEMLPMIVTSNLAKGSQTLAKKKVIVKELNAIQNLGAMNVLCTDKTGTITEDRVVLVEHVSPLGDDDPRVLDLAFLNSNYQTGWKNLMDHAIINYYETHPEKITHDNVEKIDEIPFDFSRRRLTIALKRDGHHLMITKGAVEEMASVCSHVEIDGEILPLTDELLNQMNDVNRKMNEQGMRVITVAYKRDVHDDATYEVADEKDMILAGFVGFLDPAKQSAVTAISSLHHHGVTVKVLTGDNEVVSRKVCGDVGIEVDKAYIGTDLDKMSEDEFEKAVNETNLFAKLNPMQKARIIQTLQKQGNTVGFMGDGINDAPALRTADVGISVDTAADITKEASSIILLEKSLTVLEDGVIEGRKVFKNMMKYILITISSNFGNVFSVLIASAFLPFLPMLSLQLLVQNLVYDISQLAMPWDNVDESQIMKPVKFDNKNLFRFTVFIGPISSIFDIVTFGVMWYIIGANTVAQQSLFQTGWFLVGLISQTLVVYMVRTEKVPFIQSRASAPMVIMSLLAVLTGIVIVLVEPLRDAFDFTALPSSYWGWLIGIVFVYMLLVQLIKNIYIKKYKEWI
ncbi:magnesium-translocating P-type ATPase [Vagococcus fluvialis]|uniref:magnesium-translocating P-type ATPase n=1 Tax=Vagococcus fluvialis TaxID=2738 RepID=UPI001A8F77CD|nr:magnesium-translocating P-type ATPase [Vagococcus fluvialis]MBO0443660.1 magnesium-translocating P-type ATPase [Vagococcus fluvialis]MDT2747579.1 magnesium-translocating P-type ATPase [Vagococcus fluvialis]